MGEKAPVLSKGALSPVHFSEGFGVHADIGEAPDKEHVPFVGQTTIDTFGNASYENDRVLAKKGGTYQP